MKKIIRYFSWTLLILIMAGSLNVIPVRADTATSTTVSFFKRTISTIVNRASDLVYYLIMQKRYIFDGYTDPNIYFSLQVPSDVEKVISSTSSVSSPRSDSGLVTVTTSTINDITPQKGPVSPAVTTPIIKNAPKVTVSPTVSSTRPTSASNSTSRVLYYTNQERTAKSLSPLVANYRLDQIAALRADDLFNYQYFEHTSPDGQSASDLARKLSYDYLVIGENLALGVFGGQADIVKAWMDSPGHRANILNADFTELGVAVKQGTFNGQPVTIAVQIFAQPLSNCPKPDPSKKALIDSSSASIREMQTTAQAMYADLTAIKNNPQIDRAFYNQKIQEYNYYAKKVNDAVLALKGIIDAYNQEVAKFNDCIKI
jgi:uncharacterized protein YkwD